MYLRSVLRSTSRLPAISLSERPACQCIKISVTSITSNVLLAIGLPSSTGGKAALSRWPGPPRHARHPHGELRERGGELRERQPLKPGNYVSADMADLPGISCVFSDGTTARFDLGGLPCPDLVGDLLAGLAELIHPHGTVDAAGSAGHYVQSIRDMARKLAGRGFTGRAADLRRPLLAE